MFLINTKITVTPSLFQENNFVTDFQEKMEVFNSFLTRRRSLIKKESELLPGLHSLHDKCFLNMKLSNTDTINTMQDLDSNGNIMITSAFGCSNSVKTRYVGHRN